MFQQWSTLGDFRTVSDVLTNVGLNDEAWEGWLRHIGPLGNDPIDQVRLLRAKYLIGYL